MNQHMCMYIWYAIPTGSSNVGMNLHTHFKALRKIGQDVWKKLWIQEKNDDTIKW